MMPLAAICALAGMILGSFANVLVHRLPRGQSIVRPGSRCPACGHALGGTFLVFRAGQLRRHF